MDNKNEKIVNDFGNEWEKFNQIDLNSVELKKIFEDYFDLIKWSDLNLNGNAIDVGCGTGRWARLVAQRFKKLSLLDGSSKSLKVSKKNAS